MGTRKRNKDKKNLKIPTPQEMLAIRDEFRLERARNDAIGREEYIVWMETKHREMETKMFKECLHEKVFFQYTVTPSIKKFLVEDLQTMGFVCGVFDMNKTSDSFYVHFPRGEKWPNVTSPNFSPGFTAAAILKKRMKKVNKGLRLLRNQVAKEMHCWDLDEFPSLMVNTGNYETEKFIVPMMVEELKDYEVTTITSTLIIKMKAKEKK